MRLLAAAALLASLSAAAAAPAPVSRLDPLDAFAREQTCKRDSDCFLEPFGCERKAVNSAHRLTKAERRKRAVAVCRGVALDEKPAAVCAEGYCRVRWDARGSAR